MCISEVIVSKYLNLFISAKAGMGKTATLVYVAMNWVEGKGN